jgi:aminomethyltransferase
MGEVTVTGTGAGDFLNYTLTNDIHKLASGQGQYTLMCNERGGVIDDLYAYRLSADVFLLIINASRVEPDVAWLQAQAAAFSRGKTVEVANASHRYAAVALQGPRVIEFIGQCITGGSNCAMRTDRVTDLKKNEIGGFPFRGADILISRTGYTGEDGFEIVGRDDSICQIWDELLKTGGPFGLKPCGLGARDTLRTEVCYPLYGQELDEETTPIEAGLGFFVSLEKGGFVGSPVLADQKTRGVKKRLIAFKMTGKSAPPRPHYPICAAGAKVGEVTSGTQSPSLGIGIGLGYVPSELAKTGTEIEIEIRGKRSPALVVKKPIYQRV